MELVRGLIVGGDSVVQMGMREGGVMLSKLNRRCNVCIFVCVEVCYGGRPCTSAYSGITVLQPVPTGNTCAVWRETLMSE